jgi:hypothetical protein
MTKLTAAQRKARALKFTASSTFYVSAAATIAANVYASEHTWIGAVVGLWPPLAFFFSLELIERIPLKGRQAYVRYVAIGLLAAIAGWTSYWHLVEVVRDAGTTDPVTVYGLPLTVDVLMGIARSVMNHKPAPSRPAVRRKPQAAKAKAKPQAEVRVLHPSRGIG